MENRFKVYDRRSKRIIDDAVIAFHQLDVQVLDGREMLDDFTLMTFTGQADFHGELIFTGHKVQSTVGAWIGEIVFDDGAFKFKTGNEMLALNEWRAERLEIIGTIFEEEER